jgi:hypothetical protein
MFGAQQGTGGREPDGDGIKAVGTITDVRATTPSTGTTRARILAAL